MSIAIFASSYFQLILYLVGSKHHEHTILQ